MTNAEILERLKKHRSLLPRLDAGDELHREAAAEIRRIQKQSDDDLREAGRDASAAYTEGRWDERQASEDR